MAKQQFKAESKKLLDMMINSIYTHKEIFLRELISNASDAIDKRHFKSLTDTTLIPESGYEIRLSVDKDARQLTLSDNGIGMTQEELENNLGVIAKSGSLDFKTENAEQQNGEDMDIIGQFGVGFYSAFMVSSKVRVVTKACGSEQAYAWESDGADGYSIEPCEKATCGTDIILTIKENKEEGDDYDSYLTDYRLSSIVKKYSDYIRYPIKMLMQRSKMKPRPEDAPEDYQPEYDTVYEDETLNSMVPLWKKAKKDVTDEEYNSFYMEKYMDWQAPARVMHVKTEGVSTYTAMMFIPKQPPFDYYTKNFEKGLQLYASGVLIMDKCADLLPDYFSFVRGLVDSADLSLNISREILQHDRQLKSIAKSLEKKIKSELLKMLKEDREAYDAFWKNFGIQIKVGAYANYGADKEKLRDLLMFYSAKEQKMITLDEYVEKMPEGQKDIYYAAGESIERLAQLPQAEQVRNHGYDILYLTDEVDEFCLQQIMEHKEKKFQSISSGDLDLTTEEEKKAAEEQSTKNKPMFDLMKEALGGKVEEVRVSSRLLTYPVCLSSTGNLTLEMEKVLNSLPNADKVAAKRVLEINSTHPIFQTLCGLYESDQEKLKQYTSLLYNQALLIEGMPIDDPAEFSNAICGLMAQ